MTSRLVADAIRSRRSIRQFHADPISEEVIGELVETALWAPSPHNSQPWRFVSLGPMAKSALARSMANRLRRDLERAGVAEPQIKSLTARSIARIDGAPNAILCSLVSDGLVLTGDADSDVLERQMAVQSVGAVLQSLFLAADERGIGTCWMAAPMYCADTVRAQLDLPAGWDPQALVLLGWPARPGRDRGRKDTAGMMITR